MDYAYWRDADRLIRIALDEDLPARDVTTEALGLEGRTAAAAFVAKQELVVSGLAVARRVLALVDATAAWEDDARDGDRLGPGAVLARVRGPAPSLLAAERTALNFLQRLCGVATLTRSLVDRIGTLPVALLDTRKTTPGWRLLEKAAVRDGGGANHRVSLSDAVLIKDNHVLLCGGVGEAVRRARGRLPAGTPIEVEVGDLAQAREALEAGAEVVLLDNADPRLAAEAARLVRGRAVLELSGGIHAGNVRAMAESGADRLSSGAITHSAPAADISLEFA